MTFNIVWHFRYNMMQLLWLVLLLTHPLSPCFLLSKDGAICQRFVAYLECTEFNVIKLKKIIFFWSNLTLIGLFKNVLTISLIFGHGECSKLILNTKFWQKQCDEIHITCKYKFCHTENALPLVMWQLMPCRVF